MVDRTYSLHPTRSCKVTSLTVGRSEFRLSSGIPSSLHVKVALSVSKMSRRKVAKYSTYDVLVSFAIYDLKVIISTQSIKVTSGEA
jgi:hypothetical protein